MKLNRLTIQLMPLRRTTERWPGFEPGTSSLGSLSPVVTPLGAVSDVFGDGVYHVCLTAHQV